VFKTKKKLKNQFFVYYFRFSCCHTVIETGRFIITPCSLDHVRCFLRYHYDRCVGVCGDQCGHDGRVHHPEPIDAVHLELRVHHSGLVTLGTHLGGTHRIVRGHGVVPNHALPVSVRMPWHRLTTGERYVMQTAVELAERRGLGHFQHKIDAPYHRVHVLSGR